MLHDMSKQVSESKKRAEGVTRPKPTTKAEVEAADKTAKAAEAASDALHRAAGYAQIAAQHLGSKSTTGTSSDEAETESKSDTQKASVDLKPEAVKAAAGSKPSVHHKIIGAIKGALDSGGSEAQKLSKIKAALKSHGTKAQPDAASTSTEDPAADITKKMLSDMEVNNKRWEKRAALPYTGTHVVNKQDLSDAQATSIAAKVPLHLI